MKMKKLLSLFTAAAMSISAFAGMAVTADAAEVAYAEWVPNAPGASNIDTFWSANPLGAVASSAGTKCSNRAPGSDLTYTDIKGKTKTFSGTQKGVKMESSTNITFTPNLTAEYESYDVVIAAAARYADPTSISLTYGETTVTTPETNAINAVTTQTVSGLTADSFSITRNGSKETVFFYVGIKYNPRAAGSANVESVEVSPKTATVKVGETQNLSASVLPIDAKDLSVSWTTSNDKVATVDENGVVTAVAAGEATITATSNGDATKSDSAVITVIDRVYYDVTVPEGVTATPNSAEEGTTVALTANLPDGKLFDGFVVNNGNITLNNENKFTMPAENVNVTMNTHDGIAVPASAEVFNSADVTDGTSYTANEVIADKTSFTVHATDAGASIVNGCVKGSTSGTPRKVLTVTPKKNGTLYITTRVLGNAAGEKTEAILNADSTTAAELTSPYGVILSSPVISVEAAAGQTYTFGGYGTTLEVTQVAFAPEAVPAFEPATAVAGKLYNDTNKGDFAQVYTAEPQTAQGLTANYVKWNVTLNDGTVKPGVSPELPKMTDVQIVYALIVTGTDEQINNIKSVEAVLSDNNVIE